MIRMAVQADVPELLSIYAPYVERTTITFEYDVPSEEEFLQRYCQITAQYPFLVWEENGRILGYAYAAAPYTRAAYRWCAEPSVYLRPQARRQGIGRKLYGALEWILGQQGYQVLYALVTTENTDSLRFHEKMGYFSRAVFPDCGYKFGRWMGITWMEKRIKTVQSPGGFPLPWQSIVQDAETFCDILDNFSLSYLQEI